MGQYVIEHKVGRRWRHDGDEEGDFDSLDAAVDELSRWFGLFLKCTGQPPCMESYRIRDRQSGQVYQLGQEQSDQVEGPFAIEACDPVFGWRPIEIRSVDGELCQNVFEDMSEVVIGILWDIHVRHGVCADDSDEIRHLINQGLYRIRSLRTGEVRNVRI